MHAILRRRAAGAVLVPALLLLAGAAPGQEPPPEPNVVYEFDVPFAPVCLDGEFPLRLELVGGYLPGTLAATTDPRGRVTGTWTAGETVLAASGRVSFGEGGNGIRLVLSAKGERISLKGDLFEGGFAGETSGKGTVAPGSNSFFLDTAGAPGGTARLAAVLPPGDGSRLAGEGTATLVGAPIPLKASRRTGTKVVLSMKGGGVSWTASGAPGEEPGSATVAWTARGWGGRISGEGLGIAVVPPPSGIAYADPDPLYEAEEAAAPNAPTAGGGPVKSWTVSPPLPAGLAIDPATGVLTGTPLSPAAEATHTVTASNLAGSATATLDVTVRGNRAYSFAPEARTLDDADHRHLLLRTHFGVKGSELASLQSLGLSAFLDDMLLTPSGTAVETAAFAELVNGSDPPGLQGGFPSGTQISRWWTRILVDTDRPFQEAMALFWHDHMPIAWDVLGGGQTHFFVSYANLLRHQGTGNLRNLLLAVAREPGMLVYLDGVVNTRTAPNENFAREFWELFTLGVDNGYTQADIVEAARAFTGYRQRLDAVTGQYYVQFETNRHDAGSKSFFGAVIPGQNVGDDFAAVVDLTLALRPVDVFLARKIFEHFAYEAPPAELVDAMAADLRAGNWELAPFLKKLFSSEAFFSKRARAGRVKSPIDYTVGLVRSTGLELTPATHDSWLSTLGHRPGLPPTVNGWPLGTFWYSAASMVNRTNFSYAVVGDVTRQNGLGMNIANVLPPPGSRTDQACLDAVASLMRVELADGEEADLLDYMNTARQSNGTVLPSPFDGNSQAHLDERVRGLVYVLSQHPGFQVK